MEYIKTESIELSLLSSFCLHLFFYLEDKVITAPEKKLPMKQGGEGFLK